MEKISSPLKWHGGKAYLARRIVELMPPHVHYIEPFAGSLAVLLAKNPEGVSEVVNDLHGALINFWLVLRCPKRFPAFQRAVEATPFSEEHWSCARSIVDAFNRNAGANDEATDEALTRWAVAFFVYCRQSLAGRMACFAPLSRTRTRRGMNEQASAWLSAVAGLPAVHDRLRRVVILKRNALDVIYQQDGPDALFYLDPPYLHETRQTTDAYNHEMSEEDHKELLAAITDSRRLGKFMLSGYPHPLYEAWLTRWRRHDFDMPNHAAGGDSKRRMTERVWTNF